MLNIILMLAYFIVGIMLFAYVFSDDEDYPDLSQLVFFLAAWPLLLVAVAANYFHEWRNEEVESTYRYYCSDCDMTLQSFSEELCPRCNKANTLTKVTKP